jgi:hypothetical protein
LRQPDDRYETPDHVTQTIVSYLRTRTLHLLEPAIAPADRMGKMLRKVGFRVTSMSGDFLQCRAVPNDRINCIVTNPPYGDRGKLGCEFIRHALALEGVRHVVLLLPVDFDSAITRTGLFRDCRAFAHKIILLGRIKWFPGPKSPSTNHAWYCWDRAHRGPASIGYAMLSAGRTGAKPRRGLHRELGNEEHAS